MEEIAKVIETIRKLSVRTIDRGCTEAEANQAMNRIDKLMRTYNLTLDKVFLEQERCVTKTVFNPDKAHPITYVSVAIAGFCDVRSWRSGSYRGSEGHTYNYFGMESDVDMAIYLFQMVKQAIDTETAKAKLTDAYKSAWNRRGFTASFGTGMSNRLSDRLNTMREQRRRDEDKPILTPVQPLDGDDEIDSEINSKTISEGTSLVVLKINKVQDEFEKLGMKLRKGSSSGRRITNGSGYNAGTAAGDRVNLGRPVSGSGTLRIGRA